MRSSEAIKLEDIHWTSKKKELVEHLVERKINDLSYGGIKRMEAYVKERLGVDIFPDELSKDKLALFLEVRNILVHNRGVVNALFLQRVKNDLGMAFKLNERIHVDFDRFVDFQEASVRTAQHIDAAVASKFHLQRKKMGTWGNLLD